MSSFSDGIPPWSIATVLVVSFNGLLALAGFGLALWLWRLGRTLRAVAASAQTWEQQVQAIATPNPAAIALQTQGDSLRRLRQQYRQGQRMLRQLRRGWAMGQWLWRHSPLGRP